MGAKKGRQSSTFKCMRVDMSIGILKELITSERRVIANPETVKALCDLGYVVIVEGGAGEAINISDQEYMLAGANISDAETIWNNCDYIIKYKAPIPEEYNRIQENQHIFAIFHAENNEDLIRILLEKKVTAVSLEFCHDGNSFCLAKAGGAMAGRIAAIYALYHSLLPSGRAGKIICNDKSINPVTNALIIGSGNVAKAAAKTFIENGCEVTFLVSGERSLDKLKTEMFDFDFNAYINEPKRLTEMLKVADIVIGAILISTYDTPTMISKDMVISMKRGSILIDATAGYGPGYIETFAHNTNLSDPYFYLHDVMHIKIDNLPAAAPISSVAYANKVYRPYLIECFQHIQSSGIMSETFRNGMITANGEVTHSVIKHHQEILQWNF